ncbi:MAG: hypothetical protein ACK5JT_10710, partial [Hyphomicrobiaceae bacterium]
NIAQATVDSTAPRALSIIYTVLGKTDPGTGRIGQGRVDLVLTVSEALQTPPYLAIVPQGGIPIVVELASTGNTTYAGSFLIGVMRTDGTGERVLTEGFHNEGPTWAPNGRFLMFFRDHRGANGGPKLYFIDVTGRNERLVKTRSFASDPAWSPLLA